jgi:hypothetical protein
MIVPTWRCAFFAAVMLLAVFMSDIALAKKSVLVNDPRRRACPFLPFLQRSRALGRLKRL